MSQMGPMGDDLIELDIHGVRREYLLHVSKRKPKQPAPLVILLHGTGGSARWAQEETQLDQTAKREGFVIVYPQALTPDPKQPPKFLTNPPMWNAGSTLFPNHKPDDLGFICELLDDMPRRTPIDPSRVYVTGFSNGAAMCFELAAKLGDRIAAIAPIAGYCRIKKIGRPVPTLYIIGADDPMVPPRGGEFMSPWTNEIKQRPPVLEGLNLWAKLLGCRSKRTVIEERNGVLIEQYPGPVEFQVIIVSGLGHHWPGGQGRLKKKLAGEPSQRLNANKVMWSFFRRHQLLDRA